MKGFSYSIKERMTPRNDFVFKFCGEVKEKNILDIGCGFGWYEKMAVENCAGSIIGIEPDEKSFRNARNEVKGAHFKIGTAIKLPFKNSSFDKVVMLEVLEHLPKNTEEKALEEISRVLKPGGELVISTPNLHFLSCLLDPVWLFGHRHYRLSQIIDILKRKGFSVERTFIYGGFWELIRMCPHYLFKWLLNAEDPLKIFFEKKMLPDRDNPNNFAYIYIKARKNEK